MNFKVKQYKVIKTKRLLKNYTLFFFKLVPWPFKNFIFIKRKLKLLSFNSFKTFINTLQKLLNDSIFALNTNLIKVLLFLIFTFQIKFFKKRLISFLKLWFYNILALKIHNKIYNETQIKSTFVFNYNNYKLLLVKYFISLLKNKNF